MWCEVWTHAESPCCLEDLLSWVPGLLSSGLFLKTGEVLELWWFFEEGGGVEGIDVSLDGASTFYHFFITWGNDPI